MAFNTALVPVSVTDEISSKSLPPSRSFCNVNDGNLVMTALKKAQRSDSLIFRYFEARATQEGRQ